MNEDAQLYPFPAAFFGFFGCEWITLFCITVYLLFWYFCGGKGGGGGNMAGVYRFGA